MYKVSYRMIGIWTTYTQRSIRWLCVLPHHLKIRGEQCLHKHEYLRFDGREVVGGLPEQGWHVMFYLSITLFHRYVGDMLKGDMNLSLGLERGV